MQAETKGGIVNTGKTDGIAISSTYRYMEIFLLVGLIYLVLTTIMTFIVGKVEKKVGAYE